MKLKKIVLILLLILFTRIIYSDEVKLVPSYILALLNKFYLYSGTPQQQLDTIQRLDSYQCANIFNLRNVRCVEARDLLLAAKHPAIDLTLKRLALLVPTPSYVHPARKEWCFCNRTMLCRNLFGTKEMYMHHQLGRSTSYSTILTKCCATAGIALVFSKVACMALRKELKQEDIYPQNWLFTAQKIARSIDKDVTDAKEWAVDKLARILSSNGSQATAKNSLIQK